MIDTLLTFASGLLLALGSFFMLSGAIGLVRFPDFYTRMHAAGITDTLAAFLVISGLMLLAGWSLALFKLGLILLFIFFTNPAASHALAKAAQHGELRLAETAGHGKARAAEPAGEPKPALVAEAEGLDTDRA